jgi:hypothetical protein
MPSKPREQWIPNHKLRAARERVYGRKSRTPFANAVKRRCEARFGGHCGVDHRKIRRWEEGECVPDLCHQEVICELFEVPWEERDQLGFPVPHSSQPLPELAAKTVLDGGLVLNMPLREVLNGVALVNGQCPMCGSQNGAAGWPASNGTEDDANRRKASRRLGTAALALAVPGTSAALGAQLAAALQRPRYLDTKALDDLQALVADCGRRSLYTPPAKLFAEVGPRLRQLTRLLDEPLSDSHRHRLYVITGDLAGVTAWLARDLRDSEGARACFEAGMRAAQEAGDHELSAYLLASLGHVTTDRREAANLLSEAAVTAQKVGGRSTHAWIAGGAAENLAAVKDVAASRAMLRMAERATNQITREEQSRWVHHWDHSRFLLHQGVVELRLDQPQVAQAAFEHALSALHPALARLRSGVMAHLAVAHFGQGHIDEGCVWTHRAIDLAADYADMLRVAQICQLKMALQPYMDTRAAQEVGERLRVECPL